MRTDYLLDDDFDLIADGDEWAEGESTEQEVQLIVLCNKGENTEFPTIGFGAAKRLKQRVNETKFLRELEVELEADGFEDPTIDVSNGIDNLYIEV